MDISPHSSTFILDTCPIVIDNLNGEAHTCLDHPFKVMSSHEIPTCVKLIKHQFDAVCTSISIEDFTFSKFHGRTQIQESILTE